MNFRTFCQRHLGFLVAAVALAIAVPAVALSDTYDSANKGEIVKLKDSPGDGLDSMELEGANGMAINMYYFGGVGTCYNVPDSVLSDAQIDRLVQAQVNNLIVTPYYETGAWGGYKCLTGFDLRSP